ncbi:hypothetical protein BGZ94_001296 [Podila epigama]|nr:hypothetical protein BGZ94_001296 [Podila epigama]
MPSSQSLVSSHSGDATPSPYSGGCERQENRPLHHNQLHNFYHPLEQEQQQQQQPQQVQQLQHQQYHTQHSPALHTPTHKHQHIFQSQVFNNHSQVHQNAPQGPDTVVMEFISKIGQIIIKARTASPAVAPQSIASQIPGSLQTPSEATSIGSGSATASNASVGSDDYKYLQQPQRSLEHVLQDIDLWRNSTPVHVNILHAAQHVLLERWVISFTPPAAPTPNPMISGDPTSVKSPFSGFKSPKSKQLPSSPSLPSNKDTTDLVLLLQSLYTQIRSLPLQNCLTSFDEKTKLAKTDLDYSVTSAHEDISQPRHEKSPYYHRSQQDFEHREGDLDEPVEDPYTKFTSSLKASLPLEFVQAASLKVINYEASHMQWGCVRVTGMYDESVGGRIDPKDFQDSSKIQKKKHHRSKGSSHSSSQDTAAKLAKRQQKELLNAHKPLTATDTDTIGSSGVLKQVEGDAARDHANDTKVESGLKPVQRPLSPISSPEERFHARLQELKRIEATKTAEYSGQHSVLQESAMPKHDQPQTSVTDSQERMQAYQFPPPPSPPLSIPPPKHDRVGVWRHHEPSPPSTEGLDRLSSHLDEAPQQQHTAFPSFHQGLPPTQPTYQHAHCPISTSPLAHVITRRRSSRLSIVMTCNDDSPDTTRPQSPETLAGAHGRNHGAGGQEQEHEPEQEQDYGSIGRPQYRRRGSHQDPKMGLESQGSYRATGHSPPPRYSFLRRSSLNLSHGGDLFGSLVGSYEESILSGRMSTLPSKPLIFTAQIGVLAKQDYKDCPPKLRCPKHVLLEFPAVFYDYDSSAKHQSHSHHSHGHSHSHSHSHNHGHGAYHGFSHNSQGQPPSHSHSVAHSQSKASLGQSFGQPSSFGQSFQSLGSFSSSPMAPGLLQAGMNSSSMTGSLSRNLPFAADDPVLPYVGNLDLDNGLRGERRFARMPGGMRIPLRGQVQVVIKNPNKTAVKVFLVPYDFTDMPAGTKTFLRQKHYSTGPGIGPSSGTQGGTLRYAIHLQFCCPAPGYVYLYRSIRVVFANRVPDGKESLRVVMEGLGMGSKTLQEGAQNDDDAAHHESLADAHPPSRPLTLEDRYVKMRKGEVKFSGSKKRKDTSMVNTPVLGSAADGGPFHSTGVNLGHTSGVGLGLFPERSHGTVHPHHLSPPSVPIHVAWRGTA